MIKSLILYFNKEFMFERIKRWIEMIKISFSFIKKDKELLVYSLLSFLASLAMLIPFVIVWFFSWIFEENIQNQEYYIIWFAFVYYLVFSFIAFFFNTAIITSVQRRINWEDNKFWDWIRDASKNIWKIFIWSLINALVTTILNTLQRRFWEDSLIWKIIFWLIWWVWSIMTFFAFPLMILENKWAKESIKESASLFKNTWWERATIHIWISTIMFLISFLLIISFIWLGFLASNSFIALISIFVILAILLVTLSIFSTTCETIIKVILLNYTKTWNLPKEFENKKELLDFKKNVY